MPRVEHLALLPPLAEHGKTEEFLKSQTISAAWSSANESLAVFVTNSAPIEPTHKPRTTESDGWPLYFASLHSVPSSERRLFITDTLIIFAAFQNLLTSAQTHGPEWLQRDESTLAMRKLAIDYVNFIKECWVHVSQPIPRPDGLQYSSEHYRILYTSFSLFVVLYLPEPGFENAPVGDDLMEWLNTHFIEPSTEEGDHLSALEKPWEDDAFWPYLTRTILRGLLKASTFFLDTLSRHPSQDLQEFALALKPLLEHHPRLQQFTTERDFAYASRSWQDKVKRLRIDMTQVPEEDREDDFDNWWERLSDIVGTLEGRSEVLVRVCQELGADWKEVCGAWGIFIDTRMRREDLPDVVANILDEMPPDPTDPGDGIYAELFSGETEKALQAASDLDPWLAAHIADIMEPLGLLDSEQREELETSTRDRYVLNYAEYLHSDPTLWRITAEYMYTCGEIGKRRADEVLLHVPLKLHVPIAEDGAVTESQVSTGVVGVLKQVNEICREHGREEVRRVVCKVAAQGLVREKAYGLAVSYSTSAEDWTGLGRIVNQVLEEYIASGPLQFARYAADIAPILQSLQFEGSQALFLHRLIFTVRYAQFHQLRAQQEFQDAALDLVAMFEDDIVPTSWWAVLLVDSLEFLQPNSGMLIATAGTGVLLKKIEDISVRSAHGFGEDYLDVLKRAHKLSSNKEAMDKLHSVRLALARYFARCTVIDVGGRVHKS